jgi:hypothetical protein
MYLCVEYWKETFDVSSHKLKISRLKRNKKGREVPEMLLMGDGFGPYYEGYPLRK